METLEETKSMRRILEAQGYEYFGGQHGVMMQAFYWNCPAKKAGFDWWTMFDATCGLQGRF